MGLRSNPRVRKSSAQESRIRNFHKRKPIDMDLKQTQMMLNERPDTYYTDKYNKKWERFFKSRFVPLFVKEHNWIYKAKELQLKSANEADEEQTKEKDAINRYADKFYRGDIETVKEVFRKANQLRQEKNAAKYYAIHKYEPDFCEIDVLLYQPKEAINTHTYSMIRKNEVLEEEKTEEDYYNDYRAYVCSVVLRFLKESFEILPVDTVIINALNIRKEREYGGNSFVPILSAACSRREHEIFDYLKAEPITTVNRLQNIHSFKEGEGFEPLYKIMTKRDVT